MPTWQGCLRNEVTSPANRKILNEPKLWFKSCEMSKIKTRPFDVSNYLKDEGLAERRSGKAILARRLLHGLCEHDVVATASKIAVQTGMAYQPLGEDDQASGVYRRSVMLASGHYAMLGNGLGFTLVPWRQVLAQRLGESMSVSIKGGWTTRTFGRQQGVVL